jgi:hypothetical protein
MKIRMEYNLVISDSECCKVSIILWHMELHNLGMVKKVRL